MKTGETPVWKPAKGQFMTRWAEGVNPEAVHPEYPRPQLRRKEWMNLNGLWDYAIDSKKQVSPARFDGKILVPFPLESPLSGVKRKLSPKEKLWYRREFSIPDKWSDKRILLHFGAVDWEATVWINNHELVTHSGGYVPFSFDITDYLDSNGQNELLVAVWDPTDKGRQERGKQSLRPYIVFYTAISGIWQTVWLEPVPKIYISSIKMVPDIDEEILELVVKVEGENKSYEDILVRANARGMDAGVFSVAGTLEETLLLRISNPKLWSPETPFLYDLEVELEKDKSVIDRVSSYFGMRKIALGTDDNGIPRIELNNKPVFQYGLLDQGYWPDGLYTAPTDEALKYDIEITKELGFNMIRKHVKVEPARWYYHCDRLGLLVWQDMPNGGKFSYLFFRYFSQGRRKKSSREGYYRELELMIDFLYNSPCIVTWVPFNEGWGQFDTEKVIERVRNRDPTRLIDAASGWFDKKAGDIKDIHKYPDPKRPKIEHRRAAVLGEFGGLGWKTENHSWQGKRIYWGFEKSSSKQELTEKYASLVQKLRPLINQGLCAAVYTQTTDVEGEINGLLTYDREMIKMDSEMLKELHQGLYNEMFS